MTGLTTQSGFLLAFDANCTPDAFNLTSFCVPSTCSSASAVNVTEKVTVSPGAPLVVPMLIDTAAWAAD
jgi:hypothetical protein